MVVVLPLVNDLHSPSMRDRHWKALVVVTHKPLDKGPSFCLDDVISLGLHKHVEQVTDIVEVANKELKVESNLKKIEETWATMSFKFVPYKGVVYFCSVSFFRTGICRSIFRIPVYNMSFFLSVLVYAFLSFRSGICLSFFPYRYFLSIFPYRHISFFLSFLPVYFFLSF